jgi:hypothetical protein
MRYGYLAAVVSSPTTSASDRYHKHKHLSATVAELSIII